MDNSVENRSIQYDTKTLTRLQSTLERVAKETDEAGVPEEAHDLRLAANFIEDTIAVLKKQQGNRAERRRLEARARRETRRLRKRGK